MRKFVGNNPLEVRLHPEKLFCMQRLLEGDVDLLIVRVSSELVTSLLNREFHRPIIIFLGLVLRDLFWVLWLLVGLVLLLSDVSESKLNQLRDFLDTLLLLWN